MKRIAVYCASSAKIAPIYFEATERLAKLFVNQNIQVVFGGADGGLMGKLADTVIEHGGRIKGVMPRFMKEIEWAHKGVTDFEFTDTMHERKTKYLEGVDGLVALPGGSGTLVWARPKPRRCSVRCILPGRTFQTTSERSYEWQR